MRMLENETAGELFRRVRAGDEQAAAELVRRYEPAIRRRVRVWLRLQDPRLRRVFDSMDVCQSVLASFFVRAAAGQYDLEEPGQLIALLFRMARHKLAHQVTRQQAARRDVRRDEGSGPDAPEAADTAASPSSQVAGRELLEEFRRRLDAEERQLAERRADGRAWADIAEELGGTAEGRRKQLARALDRVAQQLGLDEGIPDD
jgi:RNA polymerase sigma-70 factor (ECF subfamily)